MTKNEHHLQPRPAPLPADLPVPTDDGAARHLTGQVLPPLSFRATDGTEVPIDRVSQGRWVLFIYPRTGLPGSPIPEGWDQIPGARGCSQEACSFRDDLEDLRAQGAERVLALSSDEAEHQDALVRHYHLPYAMLSDSDLSLAAALRLPTFEANGVTLYKRLTLVLHGARIEHVFYPVFPPDTHATEVVEWLRAHSLQA